MGFLDSVFNAAKSGMDKLCVQQFNEYRSRPTDLLERQARAADNNGARRLFILAIASKDMHRGIDLANEFDMHKRSFNLLLQSNDRVMSETAASLMEALYD